MTSECISGTSHSLSWNSAPYHLSDRFCGGKRRLCAPFSDTPVTTTSGASSSASSTQI